MISEQNIHQIFGMIGKSVLETSFLGKGEASTVLKISTNDGIYALKTAQYPERKEKVLNEAEFRHYFIDHGISCVPAPVYSDSEIFPNGAVIYEFVDGIKPDFTNFENLKQMAHILSQIHQIEYDIIDDGFHQIMKLYKLMEKTIHKIKTEFPHLVNDSITSAFTNALNEYNQILKSSKEIFTTGIDAHLHGDLSDNFVIAQNGKIWLLDWENSEYGDIVDELCWFLYANNVSHEDRANFFREYQHHFKYTQQIDFEEISRLYFASTPVLDICWGMDQMGTKLDQNLEPPGRKLNDLAISAREWSRFYSDSTSSLIVNGIEELKQSLLE
ncbi:MAG: aminoglycoside phosphotransferase family protein [Promethearchaeota archaeon]